MTKPIGQIAKEEFFQRGGMRDNSKADAAWNAAATAVWNAAVEECIEKAQEYGEDQSKGREVVTTELAKLIFTSAVISTEAIIDSLRSLKRETGSNEGEE